MSKKYRCPNCNTILPYSGKGRPPKQCKDQDECEERLANSITYVRIPILEAVTEDYNPKIGDKVYHIPSFITRPISQRKFASEYRIDKIYEDGSVDVGKKVRGISQLQQLVHIEDLKQGFLLRTGFETMEEQVALEQQEMEVDNE